MPCSKVTHLGQASVYQAMCDHQALVDHTHTHTHTHTHLEREHCVPTPCTRESRTKSHSLSTNNLTEVIASRLSWTYAHVHESPHMRTSNRVDDVICLFTCMQSGTGPDGLLPSSQLRFCPRPTAAHTGLVRECVNRPQR